MVIEQVKQIDKNADNQIDVQELVDALKPNGFLSKEEDVTRLGELLNNGGDDGLNQELLSSLEQSFYSLESQIIQKEDITDEDVYVLNIYMKLLGGKCENESRKIQVIIERHDMKKIIEKDNISSKEVCTLQSYIEKIASEGIQLSEQKISKIHDRIQWHDIQTIMKECNEKGRIPEGKRTEIIAYLDKLGSNNSELQTSEQSQRIDKIQEFLTQQNAIINKINDRYKGLDQQSKNLLSQLLGEGTNLVEKIDNFIEGDINIETENAIKGINVLNQVLQDDAYTHEKLQQKVDESVKDMMHSVNEIIAKNKNYEDPKLNYKKEQVMAIQLWANVCHGRELPIDGQRCKNAYSLDGTPNQKLTSVYIYRLEFITRKDVIDYRHNDKDLATTDDLLNFPELDVIFSTLSIEDQDAILMDFLSNCYLRIRQSGMSFENQIQGDNLRELLNLAIKEKTEGNVSIEEGIEARQQLIENLKIDEDKNKDLIADIQKEIGILSQKDANGNYLLKNMGEYYAKQYENLKSTINAQNKNNVDIAHRQHALAEWSEIQKEWTSLLSMEKGGTWYGDYLYDSKLGLIFEKLSNLYNNQNTPQYKQWMESGEIFDPLIIQNIAIGFCKLNQSEQSQYGKDFCNFMKKRGDISSEAVEEAADIVDITTQIDKLESHEREFSLEPYNDSGNNNCYKLSLINKDDKSGISGGSYWPYFGLERARHLKNVYNQRKKGEINLVTDYTGSYKFLYQYKKSDNGDISLFRYNKDYGTFEKSPSKIISQEQIRQANLTTYNALESIKTKEFDDVMHEFSEDKDSFQGLQTSMQDFLQKFNNKELTDLDAKDFRQAVVDICSKIGDLKKQLPNLKRLKDVLIKIKGNESGITNAYEQQIESRISAIDTLISVCNETYTTQLSKLLNDIKSNDTRYKNIDPKDIVKGLILLAGFVVAIFCAPITCGASLAGFLFGFGVLAGTGLLTYGVDQAWDTHRNIKAASDKIMVDSHGNSIEIPGCISEDEKTPFFRFYNGEYTLEELTLEVGKDVAVIIIESAFEALLLEGAKLLGDAAGNLASDLSNYFDIFKLNNGIVTTLVFSPVIYEKISKKDKNEIAKYISNILKNIFPPKKSTNNNTVESLTCESVEENDGGNTITMEYGGNGFDESKFNELINEYIKDGGTIGKQEDGTTIVTYKGNTIIYKSSNVPPEYRALSEDMKSKVQNLGGVEVNKNTGEISYKNPEGLSSLRGFGAYLDTTGQGELYINPDGEAKLIVQAFGGNSVIDIHPQVA